MVSIIYSTFDSFEDAERVARILTSEKLVACVNIIPGCKSIYRWQGRIEESKECVLIGKTVEKKVDKTVRRIKELHNYETPDIIVIPITAGLKEYISYVEDETS
ncbi:MAG: divalent-cation tolerance protein CutA [Candidatus Thermoplasmatota archaeon]